MGNISKAQFEDFVTNNTSPFSAKIWPLIQNTKQNRAEIDQLIDLAIHAPEEDVKWWGKLWLWNMSKFYVRGELTARMGDLIKRGLLEDIESEAKAKILREADSYDSSKGSILTFAKRRALHAMTTEINFHTARTTDYFAGNMKKVKKAKDVLTRAEKPISLIALVSMTGLQPKKVEDALELLERTNQTPWDAIENETNGYIDVNPERKTLEQEVNDALYDAIDNLPIDYQVLIRAKYLSNGIKTIKELKDIMNIPQNQIRENTAKALKLLSENKRLAALRGAELKARKRNDVEQIEPNKVSEETEQTLMSYFFDDYDDEEDEEYVVVTSENEVGQTGEFSDVLLGIDFVDQYLFA